MNRKDLCMVTRRAAVLSRIGLLFLSVTLFGSCAPSKSDEPSIPRGSAIFLMAYKSDWSNAIRSYNDAVASRRAGDARAIRYLFTSFGALHVTGPQFAQHSISHWVRISNSYAGDLPNAQIIPIISSNDGDNLSAWTSDDQKSLAKEVASLLDSYTEAKGLILDIEPYSTAHLPFYREIHAQLASKGRTTWVFGVEALEAHDADVVVFSGYDLGVSPVNPTTYGARLRKDAEDLRTALRGTSTQSMIALPASASHEEYETESGTCSTNTGFTQQEWFRAALAAVCPDTPDGQSVGIALWGFYGDLLEVPSGSGCFRFPGVIPPTNWAAFEQFDETCANP